MAAGERLFFFHWGVGEKGCAEKRAARRFFLPLARLGRQREPGFKGAFFAVCIRNIEQIMGSVKPFFAWAFPLGALARKRLRGSSSHDESW